MNLKKKSHQHLSAFAYQGLLNLHQFNYIGGVIVGLQQVWYIVGSSLDQGKLSFHKYKIGICCFSAKHAALKNKSKVWLAQNNDNVSEWSNMSTQRLLL